MPFHFRSQRQEAAARRRQFILAFIALALVLAVMVCWLATRYYLSMSDGNEDETSASSVPIEEPAETSATLLVLGDKGQERFVLVQFQPAADKVYTLPVPASLDVGGQSLAAALQKSGLPRATELTAQTLGLPISHYISLTMADIETYMNYLEGGVTLTLSEPATYTNDSLVEATIPAGEQLLSTNQVSGLLRYTGWSDPALAHTVAAQLVAAILNRYMLPQHSFSGDYAYLANLMQTDIRIDHYNAYASTLTALADSNTDGKLCQSLDIHGKTKGGLFHPDMNAIKETALYE